MIFGKVAKTLIGLSAAGLVAVVLWPKLANYVYPNAEKQAASLRSMLPEVVRANLPDYGETRVAARGRPPGARPRPPNARRGPPGTERGGPPGARRGAPGAGRGGPGARRGPPGAQRRGPPRGRGGGRRRGPRGPVPVLAGKATIGEVPFLVEALGTARAYSTVNLKSRVDAYIRKIHVADGAKVKAGDLLVELDSRQIRAQIRQAKATLARNTAEHEQAKRDLVRYTSLLARRAGTRISLETAKTKVATTAAAMSADQAQIDNLNVQLSYYTIKAPISGRIGVFNSKEGNIIRAGDSSATGILATIVQATPIYVTFSLPQRHLAAVREAIKAKSGIVDAKPQGTDRWVKGRIALVENTIDANTGTITVQALFENKDEFLWPGQLCDLKITLRIDENIVSVPRDAVQSGQNGNFVFVIENGIARVQPVKLLRSQLGRELIAKGLKGNETLVIDGALSLRKGSRVQIRNQPSGNGS